MAISSAEQVIKIREALETGVGVISVTIDGRLVQYDRKQAMQELKEFERRAARESGRPTFIPIRF
jgi:hypothetical protein